jgi:hypothetical protein
VTVQEHLPVAVSTRSVGAAARPAGFTGSWPSVAAWGAGLIQAALGAGAIMSPGSGVPARAVGFALVTLGLVTLVWGGANLAQSRLIAARVALSGVVAGVLAMFALLALSPARTSVYAVAAGTLLLLVVAAFCARVVRRGADRPRDAGELRGILGLLLAAAVVALIVTPALGATQDALLLRDDGTLPAVTHDGH